MAEQLGERTEAPTGRKKADARRRGQVPKSPDFGSAVDLTGALVLLLVLGSSLAGGLAAIVRHLLDARSSGYGTRVDEAQEAIRWAGTHAALLVGPFLLLMAAVAYLAQFVQVGWLVSLDPLQPKLSRLNPLNGVKRLLSPRSLVRTGVTTLKLVVVGSVGVWLIRRNFDRIAALPLLELGPMVATVGDIVWDLVVWTLAVLLTIGLGDFAYQRWQHIKDLRMTKQEVKDEYRQMEGDVETKGRRLRMARQIAMQRIRQAVPKADVVVTNPTHFAVAIQYDAATMSAPKVVAKGADFLAFRIREIAVASGVPIVERPPLARALYADADVGRQVSPEFYEAIAEILAYVYRLEGRAA